MGPADGGIADSRELPLQVRGLLPELPQGFVFDPVLTSHLLDEQLGVRDDLELSDTELRSFRHPGDEAAVFGDVVRRASDRLAVRGKDISVLGLEYVAESRRAGVAARASVGRELRLQLAVSICAFCSLPL